jgi:hypothetical protein
VDTKWIESLWLHFFWCPDMHEERTIVVILGSIMAGSPTAMPTTRPPTVRRFFGLANQHMRWQLNDLAYLLDEQPAAAALADEGWGMGDGG